MSETAPASPHDADTALDETAYRAARIQSSLLVVACGAMVVAAIYAVLLGTAIPAFPLMLAGLAALTLGARAWARRPPAGAWADLPVHVAIAGCTGLVLAMGAIWGHAESGIQYYLVLLPVFSACLLSLRATLCWTTVAVAGMVGLSVYHALGYGNPLPADREGLGFLLDLALSQIVLVGLVFGAAYSQWNATQKHVVELRRRNDWITEQARELAQARDAAERASRVKSEFLATVSHEIRTPMNAVVGLTDLVLETKLDAEQRGLLETARRSAESLVTILNDILDFSKIESGRIELERRPFSLRDCIEDALEMLGPRAVEQRVELLYDHPGACADWIVGDPARIRQVVVNLLSNAIKFTGDGDVTVRVDELEHEPGAAGADGEDRRLLRIAVRDTGIGIPLDRRERLFRPFSQVDASTTRRFGGTGLGLAICRRLVELMGGEIGVESELDRGSQFHFTLPTVHDPPETGPARFDAGLLRGHSLLAVHAHAGQRALLERDASYRGMEIRVTDSLREARAWVEAGARFEAVLVDSRVIAHEGLSALRDLHAALPVPGILLASPGDLSGPDEQAALAVLPARLSRPLRSKRVAETLVGLWLGPRAAEAGAPRAAAVAAAHASEPAPDLLADQLPLRILVAEDNAVNQRVAGLMLQRLGYEPDIAGDGARAVEAARRCAYDLILMDVQMPELDGLEATREIRRLENGSERRTRIVAVTANAMSEDRRACLDAGMDDFVTKPLAAKELRAALERCDPPARARR